MSLPLHCQFRSPIPLSAYLLAASALAPLYGKLSDIIGRKPVLYSTISIFLVSSILYRTYYPLTRVNSWVLPFVVLHTT